jgi:Cu(I)/Ag(I) efflux system membrane fusion protein
MKPRLIVLILFVAAIAGGAGWFTAKHWPARPIQPSTSGRKVLFYQSAMHPWIKADRPGKCTICGMDLVPVYEGDKGFDAGDGLVALSSNSITLIHVQTDEVRRHSLRHTLRVAGTIEDDETRRRFLPAYVEGRIDKLFVNYVGAEMVEGQVIATIYSPALVNTEREYILLAAQTPDTTEAREQHARSIEAIVLRLKSVGLTEAQIAALPGKPRGDWHTEILAPMSGIVVARHVYEGQYVKEGDKLFEIGDFSTMWFKFDAYERDLPWLRVGQEVEVTTPAVPGKVYPAKITFIDPNLNEPTRSAKVRVDIPNPIVEQDGRAHRELYHRLYAEAAVNVDLAEVLAVPRSAVLAPGAQAVVYVDRGGGTYEQRRVRLGRAGDDSWEVLEGVSEGERVVTAGNLLIDAQAQLNQSVDTAGTSRTP